MKHYYVTFKAHSNKFNEDYIANQTTTDLENFEKNHQVVEAYECIVGRYGIVKTIGKKVR